MNYLEHFDSKSGAGSLAFANWNQVHALLRRIEACHKRLEASSTHAFEPSMGADLEQAQDDDWLRTGGTRMELAT